jgi:hypothetical protein
MVESRKEVDRAGSPLADRSAQKSLRTILASKDSNATQKTAINNCWTNHTSHSPSIMPPKNAEKDVAKRSTLVKRKSSPNPETPPAIHPTAKLARVTTGGSSRVLKKAPLVLNYSDDDADPDSDAYESEGDRKDEGTPGEFVPGTYIYQLVLHIAPWYIDKKPSMWEMHHEIIVLAAAIRNDRKWEVALPMHKRRVRQWWNPSRGNLALPPFCINGQNLTQEMTNRVEELIIMWWQARKWN